jgi:general secretion pathway protein D
MKSPSSMPSTDHPRVLRACVTFVLAAAFTLVGCASGRLQREGSKAIDSGNYEEGVAKLEQASRKDPGNLSRKLNLKARREESVQTLIHEGDSARDAGQLNEAQRNYERVLAIESGNSRARASLKQLKADQRHGEAVERAGKEIELGRLDEAEASLRAVLSEDPGSSSASALRAKIDAAREPHSVTPQLRSRDNKPVTIRFRDAPTKMIFEVLSRQTGINFIFDKDVRSDAKSTIFVEKATIEQAISMILSQNQLGQAVLAPNMALIYPDTPAKQKEYQDHIVRAFYLINAEPKKVSELVKTVLGTKILFTDDRTNLLVMRDTPQAVRMAERLIASIDVAEAEVMLEVEVLEITRTRLQELGINYPTGITLSPTPLAGDPLVLADLGDQDETTIKISDVPVSVNFKKTVGNSEVLASPRIRARNREKARVLIGDRVPVITNSVIATVTGAVSNGSVQYLDVGLTLEVEPTIRMSGDVAIKVNLEVSSIVKQLDVPTGNGGVTVAYQIGTRQANTVLELKDGETQILAGLINDSDRLSSSHIPGLGDIPLIGRLFGSRNTEREKSEIVLSITPRIVRAQARATSENTQFWYGTEGRQRSAPITAGASAAGSGPARAGVNALVDPPQANAAEADGASADGSSDADAEAAKDKDKGKPKARQTLRLDGEPSVSVGEEFSVTLSIDNAADLASIRSVLRFDPLVLQFVGGSAGPLAGGEGPKAEAGGGRIRFDLAGGQVNGSGALAVMRFKALVPRPQTMVSLQQFAATDASGAVQSIMAPGPLVLAVTP